MRFQDVVYFVFLLILAYLVLTNWKGANALVVSSASALIQLTKTLQGR